MWQLKQMQELPLEVKIEKTKLRIKEWYEHWDGQVYVSFSGGKDSTVLLHLARRMYPDVEAVFSDTGLEFPEIKEFVRSVDNVTWLNPKMGFREIIEKHGYPIISKDVANCIEGGRKGQKYRLDRLDGTLKNEDGSKSRYDRSNWNYLMGAPFKISDLCCNESKKKPFKLYEKMTKKKAIVGTMTEESQLRVSSWLLTGCNSFDTKRPMSTPLSFWTERDVWHYIKQNNIPYSKIYDMGYKRTGCVFCGFGCHLEKGNNRFQQLQISHPKLHEYCMKDWDKGGLGMAKVLDFIGVKYTEGQMELPME
jgi:3'-phosphoadenosine 5'-phosphosulfate sulfotransferase (PAPS reductase)/FAD synthetase